MPKKRSKYDEDVSIRGATPEQVARSLFRGRGKNAGAWRFLKKRAGPEPGARTPARGNRGQHRGPPVTVID